MAYSWGLGNDRGVGDNLHRIVADRPTNKSSHTIIESSCEEVADGFVNYAGARPTRRRSAGIRQTAPGDPNPQVIASVIIVHEKMGNASAVSADGDGRRVGGVVGKSDVGSAAS